MMTRKMSKRLEALETQVQRLMMKAGALSAEYDSARLSAAVGHLDHAVRELRQAIAVCRTRERLS